MEYSCELLSCNKIAIKKDGTVEPICNKCCNRDCSNPIEYEDFSYFGIIKRFRVYKVRMFSYFVTKCAGYIEIEEKNEDEN